MIRFLGLRRRDQRRDCGDAFAGGAGPYRGDGGVPVLIDVDDLCQLGGGLAGGGGDAQV